MWKFLRQVFANLVALFIYTLFFAFFAIIIIAGIAAFSDEIKEGDQENIEYNSILHIKLDRPIKEKSFENPLEGWNLPGDDLNPSLSIHEINYALHNAAKDSKIEVIFLEISGFEAGLAKLEEIRKKIIQAKDSGKTIIAYADYMTEKAYYLASACNEIYVNPVGIFELNGLNSNIIFIKGALEKLELKPVIFRVGKYKSAIETFTEEKMSAENKEQTLSFLSHLNQHMLEDIAQSREIALNDLTASSTQMLIQNAEHAQKAGLIDGILYKDEVEALLANKTNKEEDEKLPLVSVAKYINSIQQDISTENEIAVLIGEGEINGGKSDENTIGSYDFIKEIRKLRKDDDIKAVVLRINSPGGSAFASDQIWREIELLKAKKPVVASFSDLAASGGYYISMGADKIYAQPNTITGSIGIFGVMFEFDQFLKSKLGVTVDGVKTGEHSDFGVPLKPLDEFEKNVIQREIEKLYNVFTSKAAEGRKMKHENLQEIAQGRVWSGIEAKNNLLIDEYGGLEDAIKSSAELADLDSDDYAVSFYPSEKNIFEHLIEKISEPTIKIEEFNSSEEIKLYKRIKKIQHIKGVQARLPFELNID